MKRTILLIALIAGLSNASWAQVGIGNVIPDTNSILDLRNTNNRGFLLPDAPGLMPTSPKGLMYFNQSENFIYFSDTGGYNALSAWRFKYNGAASNNVYYNFGGNVGIGLTDPQSPFHIKGQGYLMSLEGNTTTGIDFFRTGYSNGRSARIYQATGGLFINNYEAGKDISFYVNGGGEVNVIGGDLNAVNGKVQEGGDDLIPHGVIVMWSGTTIPLGWKLCNGSNGTPDLRGRFIVGYDSGDSDYNNPGNRSQKGSTAGDRGGSKTHKHSVNPPNTETTEDGDHDHSYNLPTKYASVVSGGTISLNSGGGSSRIKVDFGSEDTGDAGDHTHDVNIPSFDSGSEDGRPPYYTLAFIMKVD